jgi:hypothetical protein
LLSAFYCLMTGCSVISAAPQYGQPPPEKPTDSGLNPYGESATYETQRQWEKFFEYLPWLKGPFEPPGPPGDSYGGSNDVAKVILGPPCPAGAPGATGEKRSAGYNGAPGSNFCDLICVIAPSPLALMFM